MYETLRNTSSETDQLPFDGVFEVGLTDSAVIEEYGGARAVLPSHWA